MNIQKFASHIAHMEGKKHQATIGDIREILALVNAELNGSLYELIAALPDPVQNQVQTSQNPD